MLPRIRAGLVDKDDLVAELPVSEELEDELLLQLELLLIGIVPRGSVGHLFVCEALLLVPTTK